MVVKSYEGQCIAMDGVISFVLLIYWCLVIEWNSLYGDGVGLKWEPFLLDVIYLIEERVI